MSFRACLSHLACGRSISGMVDNEDAIAELNDVIRSGVTSMEVDGQVIATDLAMAAKARRELIEEQTATRHNRPRVSTIDLSQG